MDETQLAILDLLNRLARGRANAMRADAIFENLQGLINDPGRTQEQVRGFIRAMVNDHGQLIGSGRSGFYMIIDREDVIDTIMNLVSISKSNLERADSLRTQWNIQHPANLL